MNPLRRMSTGFKSMAYVICYFKTFPLQTKKSVSFEKWLAIHNMIIIKSHLNSEGLNEIKLLQKQINNNNSLNDKTGSAKP